MKRFAKLFETDELGQILVTEDSASQHGGLVVEFRSPTGSMSQLCVSGLALGAVTELKAVRLVNLAIHQHNNKTEGIGE